ncbi:MAG: SpoIID/LytB domain-containing protein, partial [Armatimonadetes bacterium]|nr:SpoIID/LytB domain-containing protein [Armatimonadota bacterium]
MGHRLHLGRLQGSIPVLSTILAVILLHSSLFGAQGDPVIRVGLNSGIGKASTLTISCKKPLEITDPAYDQPIASLDAGQVTFSLDGTSIQVALDAGTIGSFKGPLRLSSKDSDAISEIVAFEIVLPKVRCARYRGILEIGGGAALSVVNELSLEDYVRGVIPMEVPQSFHPEAQKALAVAVRTYALTSLARHKAAGFDVCDTIDCQGFSGASKDAPWIDKLIEDTRGQIIVYKGEPIHAVYSSDCGGMTQNNEDAGFGDKPWAYLRAVSDWGDGESGRQGEWASGRAGETEDVQRPSAAADQRSTANTGTVLGGRVAATPAGIPDTHYALRITQSADYCARCPFHSWSKRFTADELDRAFARVAAAKIGKYTSMEFGEYDCSGRVKTVIVKGDQGEYRMTGSRFRDLFGQSVIKSTKMTLAVTEDGAYVIDGRGYGHGVGLCAFGADGLARSDKKITYVDILRHYY